MKISELVQHYVALKRTVGYSFVDQEQCLRSFVTFAEAAGDDFVTTNRIVEWAATASTTLSSRQWFSRARAFAVAAHAEDDRNEVPPRDVFGKERKKRPAPHIMTAKQIRKIMVAALKLPPPASITPYTYHHLIGLIASTGLRCSEAVNLLLTDLTADGLLIRETKFRKTRLVPIDASTRRALNSYLTLRRRIGGPNDHLFVISTGAPPNGASLCRAFIKLARLTGVRAPKGARGPRLHDLRHSFAVRSLEQCRGSRRDIQKHMQALSTYLGHACISDTYWYLEATPVLFRQIAESAEARHGGQLQ